MSGKVPKSEYRLADGSMYRSGCEIMELSDREAAFVSKLRGLSQEDCDEVMKFIEWKKISKRHEMIFLLTDMPFMV